MDKHSISWTGKVRGSLIELDDQDGQFLENLIISQLNDGRTYEVDEDKYRRYVAQRIRRADKSVTVTVPEDDDLDSEQTTDAPSLHNKALLDLLNELKQEPPRATWIRVVYGGPINSVIGCALSGTASD